MNQLGFEKSIKATMAEAEVKVTEALKEKGFGVLTKIDFAAKMKEKLDKAVPPTLILGACNPAMAYEAYSHDQNMLLLIPCNVTLQQVSNDEVRVSIIRPTALLETLGRPALTSMAKEADSVLETVMKRL